MDGTCVEMPDQRKPGETEGDPLVMTFNSEVLRIQQVRPGGVWWSVLTQLLRGWKRGGAATRSLCCTVFGLLLRLGACFIAGYCPPPSPEPAHPTR